jgi:hypothetical protein
MVCGRWSLAAEEKTIGTSLPKLPNLSETDTTCLMPRDRKVLQKFAQSKS